MLGSPDNAIISEIFQECREQHLRAYPRSPLDFGRLDLTRKLEGERRLRARGRAGDVFQGQIRGTLVALKDLRLPFYDPLSDKAYRDIFKRFFRELNAWANLKHINIVDMLGFAMVDGSISLVSLWHPHGNLVEYLQANPNASKHDLMLDVAEGTQYLHTCSNPLVHGDLKGLNVLIGNDGIARLADFGISQHIEDMNRNTGFTTTNAGVTGTIPWMAPELLKGCPPSFSSDAYACAAVFLEICCPGKRPFYYIETSHGLFLAKINGELPRRHRYPQVTEDDLWQLMFECWDNDPQKRPEINTIVEQLYKQFRLRRRSGTQAVRKPIPRSESATMDAVKSDEQYAHDLSLSDAKRIQIHSDTLLCRRDSVGAVVEVDVLLFDNCLILTALEGNANGKHYALKGYPIPLELLVITEPIVAPSPSRPRRPSEPEDPPRRTGVDYLFLRSLEDLADWKTMIVTAKQDRMQQRGGGKIFSISSILPKDIPTDIHAELGSGGGAQITCFTEFNRSVKGKTIVVGCKKGLWLGTRGSPISMHKIINLPSITQCLVLEDCGVFLVLSSGDLFAYDIGPLLSSNPSRAVPKRLYGGEGVHFFKVCNMGSRVILVHVRKDTSGTKSKVAVLELPRHQPIMEDDRSSGVYGLMMLGGTPEWGKLRKKFLLQSVCYDVAFLPTKIVFFSSTGFELMDMADSRSKPSTVVIPAIATPMFRFAATRGLSSSRPMGIFSCNTSQRFLLCYEDFGVYVNGLDGTLPPLGCSKDVIQWESKADKIATFSSRLLIFHQSFIEIRDVDNGHLCQIIVGSRIRCLSDYHRLSRSSETCIHLTLDDPTDGSPTSLVREITCPPQLPRRRTGLSLPRIPSVGSLSSELEAYSPIDDRTPLISRSRRSTTSLAG